MKLRSLFLSAAAIMMLAGCSNDEPKTGGDQPTIEGDADMYVSLVFGSKQRAATFDDGTAEESEVRDVTLYFFDENKNLLGEGLTATITSDQLEGSNTDNITKVVKVTAKSEIVNKAKGVVAVVNKLNNFNPTTGDWEAFNAALTVTTSANDADIINDAAQGFMMTNSTHAGADNNTETYLAAITTDNWAEVGDSKLPTPVEIYVERVAAKVLLTADNAAIDDANTKASVKVVNWGLNAVNKSYYPVKRLQSFLTAHAAGITDWPGMNNPDKCKWNDATANNRSYWAVDPNYDVAGNTKAAFGYPLVSSMNYNIGATKYLPENTMNWDCEKRLYTTSAIILAQYVPEDLIKDPNATDVTTDKNWYFYKNGNYSTKGLISKITKDLKFYYKSGENEQGQPIYKLLNANHGYVIAYEAGATDIKIGDEVVGKKGTAIVALDSSITEVYSDGNGTKTTVEAVNQALANAKGTNNEITVYVNGYCYYEVPIRHFDDSEVPLIENNPIIYSGHLGRYGVVRNHSYKLNVTSIMQPGEPITDETITPNGNDDKDKKYLIDVTIKVLAWAVRTQNIEL